MKGSRRRTLYHDRGIFTAQPEAIEKNHEVVAGLRRISALGDRSTFMPTRKNRRARQISQPEKEIMKTADLIKAGIKSREISKHR